jgi:hypothetical protein
MKKSDGGVHCFIERETGIIYKPKGWTGPAKDGRASIFKPATYKKIDPHGSWLYKIYKEEKLPESTDAYGKSLEKIANDKKLKMISKKDRDTLKRLALLMKEGKTLNQE